MKRYGNGDWSRDGKYELYLTSEPYELQMVAEGSRQLARRLAKRFAHIVTSRWKEGFSNLRLIGVGMCFNKLFQRSYIKFVILHKDPKTGIRTSPKAAHTSLRLRYTSERTRQGFIVSSMTRPSGTGFYHTTARVTLPPWHTVVV